MKILYGHLNSAKTVLERLATIPMPKKDRLNVRRVLNGVATAVQPLVDERNDLIEKYGDGGQIGPDSEKWDVFRAEYEEALNSDVEFEIEGFSEDLLDNVVISVAEEDALKFCGIIS